MTRPLSTMNLKMTSPINREIPFSGKRFSLILFLIWLNLATPLFAESLFRSHANSAIDLDNTAVAVMDLRSGKYIDTLNLEKPLVPASIMKCVTVASLLREADSDKTLKTRVYTRGKVDREGVLHGGLLIEGSGDPTLNASCEPSSGDFVREIVDELLDRRVVAIRGPVEFDESRFTGPAVPPSWAKGDLNESYGTGFHGFNFERNASGKRAVADPKQVFMNRFKAALAAAGISYDPAPSGESLSRPRILVEHESAPLSDIMRSCMMRSDNLFAESLLHLFALEKRVPGSTADAVAEEEKMWRGKKLPMKGIAIVDGSGLSRSNRVTAAFMSELLRKMKGNEVYASFFPLAGREGTVKRFLAGTGLDSYIVLKTGSMNGIQCYAGYKVDDDFRPTHAVVIMLNNMRDRGAARNAIAGYLLDIFNAAPANDD